ncbi:MAG TPA: hypothetical protein PLO51_01980, partial [Candidatus Micrarchaeota archaeon]|nr:hypothetical protein [Candidatus Micrarchaeota archaeon]
VLVSATIFLLYSEYFSIGIIPVLEASGLGDGRLVSVRASLSQISKSTYGYYTSQACDYSGCVSVRFAGDIVPLSIAGKPVIITGKIKTTSRISKYLEASKIEYA